MSDSEYEEEEYLVFADFKNQLVSGNLSEENTAIKIIGIDSKNPIAEVNGSIFKGSYDFAMGTEVFWEKDNNSPPADPLFEQTCRQKYKVLGKTDKVINFERIYVERVPDTKEGNSEDSEVAESSEKETTSAENSLKLNMSYDDAIKLFPKHSDH